MTRKTFALILIVSAAFGAAPGRRPAQGKPEKARARTDGAAVRFLRQFRPHIAARLDRIRRDDPPRYREIILDAERQAAMLQELKKAEPEAYNDMLRRLREQARLFRMAAEYQSAPPKRKTRIKRDIRKLLSDLFDRHQMELEARLREMERRIEQLREEARFFRVNRRSLVQERIDQLLDETDEVFW